MSIPMIPPPPSSLIALYRRMLRGDIEAESNYMREEIAAGRYPGREVLHRIALAKIELAVLDEIAVSLGVRDAA